MGWLPSNAYLVGLIFSAGGWCIRKYNVDIGLEIMKITLMLSWKYIKEEQENEYQKPFRGYHSKMRLVACLLGFPILSSLILITPLLSPFSAVKLSHFSFK